MAENTFPLFPKFPPEIRLEIWRTALSECWSFTSLRRSKGRVKFVGKVHRSVGQSCSEARAAMRMTHTETDVLGWVDFARHIFFFRDAKFNREIMLSAGDTLSLVQHVVINPRDWGHVWDTLDVLKQHCTSLRSLVVVAPWFDPADMPVPVTAPTYEPWEDWRQVFVKSPSELPLSSLLKTLNGDPLANAARNAGYRARLDEAAAQIPEDILQPIDHVFGRTRMAMQRLDRAVQEIPHSTPQLYPRTKQELLLAPSG